MDPRYADYPSVFLHTGDCFLGVRPTMVSTVLGSCVAVTMFSPRLQAAAICHALLPTVSSARNWAESEPQACRFVDTALERMFQSMERLGAKPRDLEIKIFGGASGYAPGMEVDSCLSIGPRNVAQVDEELDRRGLVPKVRDVGGSRGRKIFLLTSTGEIWLRRLGGMRAEDLCNANIAKEPSGEPV